MARREADGELRRLGYTPAPSQPPPVPQPAWPDDERVTPGFEFGGPARSTGPFSPGPSHPGTSGPRTSGPGTFGQGPTRAAAARPDARTDDTEWARLLRSCRPEPAKRNWFSEFRYALDLRALALRVAIPILATIVFGVSVVVVTEANGNSSGPAPVPSSLGFPPATMAGSEFTAADGGRGISQTLDRVTSDGAEIVAVGSQVGARIARAQFFVSPDEGRTWAMGAVRTPGGGPPPPGYAARFVAGGRGAWVAIGRSSIWTSTDGRTWTLSSTAGLPLLPGDQISVLKRTAAGFIAAGAHVPEGNQAEAGPVVFLSANGMSWHRLDAGRLRLAAGAGRVLGIKYAAAYGNQILIAGDVSAASTAGKSGRAVTVRTSAAWLSSDGGTTWAQAVPPGVAPAGQGARARISGEAVTGDGFILVRPATRGAGQAVDVYRSPNGTAWTFETALGTPAGFTVGVVSGGPAGAVVTGQAGRILTAFASGDGASWRQVPAFGSTSSESVSDVTMAGDGAVIAAGTTANDRDSRRPVITVLGTQGPPDQVDVAKIPGAIDRQLAVNAVAAGHGMQVAVGSANGYPAAWTSADGGSSWARAVGQSQAVLDRPGIQRLTSVTGGAAGWVAVGGVVTATAEHPVVVGSANGRSWQAADEEAAFAGPGVFTEQAAAGPRGYVIVGYQVILGRTIAAAWWSAGLVGWHRAGEAVPGALDGVNGSDASRQMAAVTASPRGFVAVGAVGNQASAWTSPDGRDWTQLNLPLPVGATRAVLQHVASEGRTVAAVGTAVTATGQHVPFAASSADGGADWTESALPVPLGHAFVTALAAAGGGFVATGTFGITSGHQDVVVWSSAGASGWTAVTPAGEGLSGPGIQEITGLTVSGSTLIGVGFTASPAGEQPVFWQSPIR